MCYDESWSGVRLLTAGHQVPVLSLRHHQLLLLPGLLQADSEEIQTGDFLLQDGSVSGGRGLQEEMSLLQVVIFDLWTRLYQLQLQLKL